MKLPTCRHDWNMTPQAAIALQRQLALEVSCVAMTKEPRYVAGLDAAFTDAGKTCIAAAVVWDMVQQQVVTTQLAKAPVYFPYIPGLLTFREGPALWQVLIQLEQTPDILLCDGQGLAHPRRLGIASHMGVLTGLPAVGCGKSRLVGCYREPAIPRGAQSLLVDRGETVGVVLRTKTKVKPIFVSVGHRINLNQAVELVEQCVTRYRLPEPTRLADKAVALAKLSLNQSNNIS